MRKEWSVAERIAAVSRLKADTTRGATSRLAKELKVTTSCLRAWRKLYGGDAPAIAIAQPSPTPDPTLATAPAQAHPALADMLAAAGSPIPSPVAPNVSPVAEAPAAARSALTVDDLVAGVFVVNDMVAEGAGMCFGVTLTDELRERLSRLDPRAERALRFLGPSALPYVDSFLDRFPKYAAIGFGIVAGLVFVRTGLNVSNFAKAQPLAPEEPPRAAAA